MDAKYGWEGLAGEGGRPGCPSEVSNGGGRLWRVRYDSPYDTRPAVLLSLSVPADGGVSTGQRDEVLGVGSPDRLSSGKITVSILRRFCLFGPSRRGAKAGRE